MSDVDALFSIYLGASTNTAEFENGTRDYKFTTPEATITTVATSVDTSLNKLKLTLTGTGFDAGDLSAVKVLIDDLLQETVSVTSTEAQIVITNMKSKTASLEIIMPDGYPAGNPPSTITVESGLFSITPPEGTSAGTTLTVRGFGFGVDTTDFDLFH